MTARPAIGALASRRTVLRGLGAGGLASLLATGGGELAAAQAGTPPVATGAVPAMLTELLAAFEAADASRLVALFTSDAVFQAPSSGTFLRGGDVIGKALVNFARAHGPHLTATPYFVVAGTDGAALDFVVTGTYVGQLPTLPAGHGQPVDYHVAGLFAFTGGKISYWDNHPDYLRLLRQIGVLPAPGTPVATPVPGGG